MKFKTYMLKKGYRPPRFVTLLNKELCTEFNKAAVYRVMEGKEPPLELAVAIELFTQSAVTARDMIIRGVLSTPEDPEEEDYSDFFDDI